MRIKKLLSVVAVSIYMGVCALNAQSTLSQKNKKINEVNPFIGNANFGTTNPGAVVPNGLMSVTPFNVGGDSPLNKYDKDARWWSTPYTTDNKYFTGFSHVNLSGVGCPELGSLLLMATSGNLDVDYKNYGSTISNEVAHPGYYSAFIDKYKIKAEVSATKRSSIAAFTFQEKGNANILLNLGQGLSNETGSKVVFLNDSTIIGSKIMGTFCYEPQAVFAQYFAMRISKKSKDNGYWKMQAPKKGVEAEWDKDNGKYKIYRNYKKDMMGDDIGAYLSYPVEAGETIYVQIGVSFTSVENALLNLNTEQKTFDFAKVKEEAENEWEKALSVVDIEGGTKDQRTMFYTAMYHLLIHPNILQDVNGDYPAMGSLKTLNTKHNRYTVYSLWDTYRNVHPLLSLLYPQTQLDMVRSMVDMYKESGWLPKWELYSQETYTMDGDPSLIVINDTYQRGLRDFDIEAAWEAMWKSANAPSKENKMRPDNDDYLKYGYVPIREQFDNSVAHALEYYVADYNLAQFAKSLGKMKEYKILMKRAMGYKNYYDKKEYKVFRPITPDGKFLNPFNPEQGKDFEPSPGFHEGTAWNYTFFVPFDIKGLMKLMGGEKEFVNKLQYVFDSGNFDPTNEPDIAYPYLFSYTSKDAWRTQKYTDYIIKKYFGNSPEGLPGNDDTGTMSTWLIYSMLGFYPDSPGDMSYTLTTPTFDKVTIKLDKKYYKNDIVIEKKYNGDKKDAIYFNQIELAGKTYKNKYRITNNDLLNSGKIVFYAENRK